MTNYLIQICWNQKNRYQDITDYYNLIQDTCQKIKGVEIYGLFKPITENWHWSYLIKLDDLEKLQTIEDEITSNQNYIEQMQEKITRIFVEHTNTPKIDNFDSLKILEIELSVWDGINIGVQKHYDSIAKVFSRNKEAWFMGRYGPANERYHWAQFYLYKSLTHMIDMDREIGAIGRPQLNTFNVERLYRLVDPTTFSDIQ